MVKTIHNWYKLWKIALKYSLIWRYLHWNCSNSIEQLNWTDCAAICFPILLKQLNKMLTPEHSWKILEAMKWPFIVTRGWGKSLPFDACLGAPINHHRRSSLRGIRPSSSYSKLFYLPAVLSISWWMKMRGRFGRKCREAYNGSISNSNVTAQVILKISGHLLGCQCRHLLSMVHINQ